MKTSSFLWFVSMLFLFTTTTTIAQTLDQHTITNRNHHSNDIKAFYDPLNDIVVVQAKGLVRQHLTVRLLDEEQQLLQTNTIYQGSTITFFDVQTRYEGNYFVEALNGTPPQQISIVIRRDD